MEEKLKTWLKDIHYFGTEEFTELIVNEIQINSLNESETVPKTSEWGESNILQLTSSKGGKAVLALGKTIVRFYNEYINV